MFNGSNKVAVLKAVLVLVLVQVNNLLGVDENIRVDLTSIEEIKASTNEIAQALNSLSPLVANRVLENLTINEIRDIVGQGTVEGGERLAGASDEQPTATTSA